ncbi:MAG: serine/threonine-protein kinase [Myxococcota bacterium]
MTGSAEHTTEGEDTESSEPRNRPTVDVLKAKPGTLLGERYVLEEPIERGAWGTVWRARHNVIGKTFAVKILRVEQTDGTEEHWAAKRMLREARVVSQISHPAVVEVVDYGKFGIAPFIVMEFLEGDTLQERLKKGAMPWSEVKPLLAQTIEGLAAAHAIGVVHRDIKPSNLFLLAGGRGLKVIDFGIAGVDGRATRITETGEVLGTPHFMSPEQTRGMNVDAASDIYSVACVAYAMLAGRPPYVGSMSEVIRQHLKGPVPRVQDAASAVPARVRAALEKALAKAPEDRFSSMGAFFEAVMGRPINTRPPVAAGPTTQRRIRAERAAKSDRRGTMAAGVVAVVFAVAAGVTSYVVLRGSDTKSPAVAPAGPPSPEPETPTPPAPDPSPQPDPSPVSTPVAKPDPIVEVATPKTKPPKVKPPEAAPSTARKKPKTRPKVPTEPAPAPAAEKPDPVAAPTPAPAPGIKKVGGLKNPFSPG